MFIILFYLLQNNTVKIPKFEYEQFKSPNNPQITTIVCFKNNLKGIYIYWSKTLKSKIEIND